MTFPSPDTSQTGDICEPTQPLSSQRSKTHTRSCGSTNTLFVEAQGRGRCAQSVTSRYGFGASFTHAFVCARHSATQLRDAASKRMVCFMDILHLYAQPTLRAWYPEDVTAANSLAIWKVRRSCGNYSAAVDDLACNDR